MAGVLTRQKSVARTECNLKDPVLYVGSFELDGNNNDPINVRGDGFTVVHSGDDDYLITFAEKHPMMVACLLTMQTQDSGGTGADDLDAVCEAYVPNSGQLVVRVTLAGSKNDGQIGERVNFMVFFHKFEALSVTHA